MLRKYLSVILLIVLQLFFTSLYSTTYIVNSTADTGAGSLREAITLANANPGADIIHFDFGVGGVKTISLLSLLPIITDELFIDGSSDPFYAGTPLVELDANGLERGLHIEVGGEFTHIHALIVNNATFDNNSTGIYVRTDDVSITGCYLGTDPTGTVAVPNTNSGIYAWFADRLTVGGTGVNEGNLISGNGTYGMFLWFANEAVVSGNKVGTDISGTSSVANAYGAFVWFCRRAVLGGTTTAHRNLFSGNTSHGLYLHFEGSHKVYGNYIGTDISGTLALPNAVGIHISADSNEIGGPLVGQENLISGNTQQGMTIFSSNAFENVVQGNLIGTDLTGMNALPNQSNGINFHGTTRTTIGGLTADERNIISGNGAHGISVFDTDSTYIYGNYIGLDITGTTPLPNQFNGIQNSAAFHTYIGNGTAAGANVISGNAGSGIQISGSSPSTDSVIIKHNYIGTDPTGLLNLSNSSYGVRIQNGSRGNILGGTLTGDRNLIAHNLLGGVYVEGATTTNNQILGNSIYDHPVPGISLNAGNNNQEAPDLTGYSTGAGTTTIFGNLNSTPNTTYRLEFFTSNAGTQGKTLIGTSSVTTDATGLYTLNEVLPVTVTAAEPVLSSTATDPNGNTSEFGVEVVLAARIGTFTAEALPLGKALLTWEVEDQGASMYFEIEHQSPTHDFIKIGRQDDYVSLNQTKLYQFEVEKLAPGTHYFRLAHIGEGGTRNYSRSLPIEMSHRSSPLLLVPNPINRSSSVEISVHKTQQIDIYLTGMNGKKIGQLFSGEIEGGTYQSIFLEGLGNVSQGLYILNIVGNDFREGRKVIVE